MKNIKHILLVLGILAGFGMAFAPSNVGAIDVFKDCTNSVIKDTAVCKDANKTDSASSFLKTLVNSLLFILGGVAVLVIIVAGVTYSMSAGDPALVTKARNTIIYAVIGLVVAILAFSVVNFVITQFK